MALEDPIAAFRSTTCVPMALLYLVLSGANTHAVSGDDRIPDDVIVHHNLRYREGESESWMLDLAMPAAASDKPRPAIVVIHGGGWLEGSRTSFSNPENPPPGNIMDFAQLGFVAVTIDYRLSGEATFPAALDDCRCAVRWLRAHRVEYGIDPERIGAWGNSAGGHLALMLGLAPEPELGDDEPHADQSSRVQAVVSDSGPIDLVHQFHHRQVHVAIERFLGGPPDDARLPAYRKASPSNCILADSPPLMLIYGGSDEQVGIETADRFVSDLAQAGRRDVTYLRLAHVGHCPHSLVRVPWVASAVNEFFVRTLISAP